MTLPKVVLTSCLGVVALCVSSLPLYAQNPATTTETQAALTTKTASVATQPAASGEKAEWECNELLNADLLKLDIVASRTAQVFHVVDQLSQWSKNCHKQYISYFGGANGSELSEEEQAMLRKHVALREKYPWGQGLEQTFYSPLDFKAAGAEGVAAGRLTAEEADTETEVLNYFAPKVDALIAKESATLTKFHELLKTERVPIAVFTRQLSRLCGNRRYKVPVYLIVNPHTVNHGSGVAGGRVILEVPRYGDAYTTLLRTILAAFVDQYSDDMNKAVVGVDGLDFPTLEEAITNALVPGLLRPTGTDDTLFNRVASDIAAKKPLTEAAVRTQRFSLMLRPVLSAALADKNQTMTTFISSAIAVWRAGGELERAANTTVSPYRASKAPSIFVFGDLDPTLMDYFRTGAHNLFTRPHQTEAYQELLGNYSKPNDTVILLATTDTLSRIPTLFSDLLPLPVATLQEKLGRGESVVLQGTARQFKIILLAAPKQVVLETLVRTNLALWR